MVGAIRRTAQGAAIAGMVAAGVVVALPTAAQAALSGCSSDVVGARQGTAYCTVANSGSHYRAKVTCYKVSTGNYSRTVYGSWKYSPAQSSATCPIGEELGNVVVDKVN